jgi:hypothetical protein
MRFSGLGLAQVLGDGRPLYGLLAVRKTVGFPEDLQEMPVKMGSTLVATPRGAKVHSAASAFGGVNLTPPRRLRRSLR